MPGSSSWAAQLDLEVSGRTYDAMVDEARALAGDYFNVDADSPRIKHDPFRATRHPYSGMYSGTITVYLENETSITPAPVLPQLPPYGAASHGRFAPSRALEDAIEDPDWNIPDPEDD